ncbi:hypothetical protein KR222_006898 [Zaprionus bogoriensis]|nr:hypothetical protein KR222_006898 [Zaprionus bogoriensis]
MFQNISFSFLCALAFISWSVLCYLHVIEEREKFEDYTVEIYTEDSDFGESPQYYPYKSTQPSFMHRGYELLISYGVVLATTVALSKLLQFIELETRAYLQRISENIPPQRSMPHSQYPEQLKQLEAPPADLPDDFQDSKVLRAQLDELQARFRELLEELRAANASTSSPEPDNDLAHVPSDLSFGHSSDDSLYPNDSDTDVLWKQPFRLTSSEISIAPQPTVVVQNPIGQQNVYVTHSHIHINFNGPVHLSRHYVNVEMLRARHRRRESEFLQVWSKYITDTTSERPVLTGYHNFLL